MSEIITHDESCGCEMCVWARRTALNARGKENGQGKSGNVSDSRITQSSLVSAPDFNHCWATAPQQRTRYTEREDAEYWFLAGAWEGIQFARAEMLTRQNRELRGIVERMRNGSLV